MMPVHVEMLRDGQVVLFRNTGNISLQELLDALQMFCDTCDRARFPVHLISDTTQITKFPLSIITYGTQRRTSPLFHPNAGMFFVVSNRPMMVQLVEFVKRLVPGAKVKAVTTIEQAMQAIEPFLASRS